MLTQVSFTVDESLKNTALEKAKNEGITLKTLLVYTMKGFVDGKISLSIASVSEEPDVEELIFAGKSINEKAAKIAELLK